MVANVEPCTLRHSEDGEPDEVVDRARGVVRQTGVVAFLEERVLRPERQPKHGVDAQTLVHLV